MNGEQSLEERAETLSAVLSMRPLLPIEGETAVNTILDLLSALASLRSVVAAQREALEQIAEPNRTDWMPGEYPLVINKMRELARAALSSVDGNKDEAEA